MASSQFSKIDKTFALIVFCEVILLIWVNVYSADYYLSNFDWFSQPDWAVYREEHQQNCSQHSGE